MNFRQGACVIGPIDVTQRHGTSRVTALVNNRPVWFESDDVPLMPSGDAMATAFLVPALHRRVPLRIEAPLSDGWLGNIRELCATLHQWWDYPQVPDITGSGTAATTVARSATAQCFSGGADSFYSLLRGKHRPDYLVFVHGYDMSCHDNARMRAFRTTLEAVAQATGCKPLMIRTNLREHRIFRSVSWNRTHGAALAAIGHLISDAAGKLVIPSSYTYKDDVPHGSHWTTDPLWSSESLQVIHDDANLYRLDKLKEMDQEPLVREHLRVCYENRARTGNCSRCDKCVRTMAMLLARNQLQHYTVFDRDTPLSTLLDRMDAVPAALRRRYHELLEEDLPADVVAAIHRLLDRPERKRPNFIRRRMRRIVRAWRRLRS